MGFLLGRALYIDLKALRRADPLGKILTSTSGHTFSCWNA